MDSPSAVSLFDFVSQIFGPRCDAVNSPNCRAYPRQCIRENDAFEQVKLFPLLSCRDCGISVISADILIAHLHLRAFETGMLGKHFGELLESIQNDDLA
jgi:hypothetical protein